MTDIRVETDSFGPLDVPADKYWGAQTQRSIQNFRDRLGTAARGDHSRFGRDQESLRLGEYRAGRYFGGIWARRLPLQRPK